MCFSISCHSIFLFSDGALPESASSCTLSNDDHFMSYYLTSEGVVSVRRVLYVVSYLNPDITYSPILQQVAAVLLHFMEEVWCFACISAMLTGKKPYFGETYLQALASDSALQACASSVMVCGIFQLNYYKQGCIPGIKKAQLPLKELQH